MGLVTLQFERKLYMCIRMGITIFKIFFWGDISSNIRSEITLYGSSRASPYIRRYSSPNKKFEYSYSLIINHFPICILKKSNKTRNDQRIS